jgi:hypothetical protein
MALRKVSVGLEADVADFIAGMEAAQHELGKVDREVESLDRSLNKIPLDSAKAAAAMKLLKGNVTEVSESIDKVGDRSQALSLLDSRIRSTRTEVRKLGDEFVKTGDIDVFKKLGQSQGNLSALTAIRKKLASALEDGLKEGVQRGGPAAASSFGDLFEGGMVNALKSPAIAAAAGVLALAIGPLIGSAVGGAIIAAGGAGVAALGVAGAFQADPERVGAAWQSEISRIEAEWVHASTAFVGPTTDAIHRLGNAIHDIGIKDLLGDAAGLVEPLSKGVAGFTTGLGRGLDALVSKAGPLIEVLKTELPEVGRSIELSLSMIAGGNKGAADGLRDILHVLEAVIVGFGGAIRFTEDLYHGIKSIGEAVRGVTDDLVVAKTLTDFFSPEPVKAYAVSLDGAAHGMDRFGDSAQDTAINMTELSNALTKGDLTLESLAATMVGKVFNALMGIDQATLSFAESLTRVRDSIKENGKSLDIHTAKGQANREAILGAVNANMQLYQAQISSGVSAEEASKKYDDNTAALERQLTKAGYTKQQIQDLIGKYKGIPGKVSTEIAMQGLTNAINGLADLYKKIYNIPDGHFNIYGAYIGPHIGSVGGKEGPGKYLQGGIRHAAEGLLVPPRDPGTVLFGEPQTGGEAFIPLRGIPQSQAMGLAQVVGNSYGFDVGPKWTGGMGYGSPKVETTITIDFTGTDQAFASAFMGLVRDGKIKVKP